MNDTQVAIYLEALKELHGREFEAMRAAGLSRVQLMMYREENPEFEEMEQDILKEVGDVVRAEVWRRAIDGIDKAVYHKGEMIDTEKKYSDTLLAMLAKAHCKEFANKVEVGNADNGPLKIEIVDFSHLRKKTEDAVAEAVTAAVTEGEAEYEDVL